MSMWKKGTKKFLLPIFFVSLFTCFFQTLEVSAANHSIKTVARNVSLQFFYQDGTPMTENFTLTGKLNYGSTTNAGSTPVFNYQGSVDVPITKTGPAMYTGAFPSVTISTPDSYYYNPGSDGGRVYYASQGLAGLNQLDLVPDEELKWVKAFTYVTPTGVSNPTSLYTKIFYNNGATESVLMKTSPRTFFTKKNNKLFDGAVKGGGYTYSSDSKLKTGSDFGMSYTSANYVYDTNWWITGINGIYTQPYGQDGDIIALYAQCQQVKETFENSSKAAITPPNGYTQNKVTDITSNDFVYTMENGDKLPEFYTNAAGNIGYIYEGWYRGSTKPATLDTKYPPEITFSPAGMDADDVVHIVYKQVTTANLIEQIRDRSGNVIESSWDQASRKVPIGEYTNTPDAVKTDTQGRKWEYVGWRVGTTGSIQTGPVSRNLTVNSTTTIQYIYEESKTTGDLSLTIEPEVIDNEGDTTLVAILKNTGTSDMKELKINFSDKWMLTNGSTSGIYSPSYIFVTVEGEAEKKISTNESNFTNGQTLTDIVIPAGKEAKIEIPIRGRGNPLEMLQAGIEISGNLVDDVGNDTTLKASNVVRVDDPEAPTIDGEGDAGFINIFKNLNFGTTTYSPSAQTKALDMTSSPYLRFYDMNDLQPQWSLQAKLDTFKTAANKTLPTATSISFKEFQLYDINDYKKTTENVSANGAAVSEFVLPSDGTTAEVTNRLNKGYYEIRTGPNNVQLNIPAFAGLSGESYSSTLTWTLSTGP